MTAKFVNGKATATEYQEAKTALLKATSNRIQAQYTFIFRQKILDFYRGVEL
jgi:outer membrane protein